MANSEKEIQVYGIMTNPDPNGHVVKAEQVKGLKNPSLSSTTLTIGNGSIVFSVDSEGILDITITADTSSGN